MRKDLVYHGLLAAGFTVILIAVGWNAYSVPDFAFPAPVYHPYELERAADSGLPDTALGAGMPAGKINLNTATAGELESLPGIGEKLAQAILEHREKQGRFRRREQVMEVPGIGEKTYAKLEDWIEI